MYIWSRQTRVQTWCDLRLQGWFISAWCSYCLRLGLHSFSINTMEVETRTPLAISDILITHPRPLPACAPLIALAHIHLILRITAAVHKTRIQMGRVLPSRVRFLITPRVASFMSRWFYIMINHIVNSDNYVPLFFATLNGWVSYYYLVKIHYNCHRKALIHAVKCVSYAQVKIYSGVKSKCGHYKYSAGFLRTNESAKTFIPLRNCRSLHSSVSNIIVHEITFSIFVSSYVVHLTMYSYC